MARQWRAGAWLPRTGLGGGGSIHRRREALQGSGATTQPDTEAREPVVSEGVGGGADGADHRADGQTGG